VILDRRPRCCTGRDGKIAGSGLCAGSVVRLVGEIAD